MERLRLRGPENPGALSLGVTWCRVMQTLRVMKAKSLPFVGRSHRKHPASDTASRGSVRSSAGWLACKVRLKAGLFIQQILFTYSVCQPDCILYPGRTEGQNSQECPILYCSVGRWPVHSEQGKYTVYQVDAVCRQIE